MPYESIPGVGATYLDGAFHSPSVSTQPRIIILGSASSGLTYRLYNVRSVSAAEKEFGATAEIMKPLHEALAQGSDNIAVMRIGGQKGAFLALESGVQAISITPEYRDEQILDRYSLIVTADSAGDPRILLWDREDGSWAYDSSEILVVDIGVLSVVVDTAALGAFTIGDINNPDDPDLTPVLADLVGTLGASTEGPFASVVPTWSAGTWTYLGSAAGDDGAAMSLLERYAALEHAYSMLDYRDGDYVIPCGTYVDSRNIVDQDNFSHWSTASGSALYTPDYSSVPTAGDTANDVLGWLWQYQYRGKVYTYFLDDGDPALATNTLTHAQLTGDTVPAAVATKWAAATEAEVRECSYAHQLASFCYRASTVWKSMLGFISFSPPAAYDRMTVAEWAGELPSYTYFGTDLGIDGSADGGDGVLGHTFVGGQAGYRDGILDDSTSGDGAAYGGLILTKGESLPNGTNFVYGIGDADELLDANDKPVDIGKHVLFSYEHPVHRNSYNGGSNYRGQFSASLAGKIAVTPQNEEPIGINGRVRRVSSPIRLRGPQMNQLARARTCGLRREDGVGFIIVSCRTAAHPNSDYTRLSTIRSVNRQIDGIRDIAKNYIGKEFSSTRLMSLQTAIDGFLKAEKALGFNQGAIASMSYTRQDKIMGRLTIKLKMIPPFSIEAITIETSLAAEETELTS
jgi:hypothetical protein